MKPAPNSPLPDARRRRAALWLVIAVRHPRRDLQRDHARPSETPDEIWHYAFVQHLATGQGLPVSAAGTQALGSSRACKPGYYLAAAALTAWIDQSDFPAVYAG